jgi:hypothetical protein
MIIHKSIRQAVPKGGAHLQGVFRVWVMGHSFFVFYGDIIGQQLTVRNVSWGYSAYVSIWEYHSMGHSIRKTFPHERWDRMA